MQQRRVLRCINSNGLKEALVLIASINDFSRLIEFSFVRHTFDLHLFLIRAKSRNMPRLYRRCGPCARKLQH